MRSAPATGASSIDVSDAMFSVFAVWAPVVVVASPFAFDPDEPPHAPRTRTNASAIPTERKRTGMAGRLVTMQSCGQAEARATTGARDLRAARARVRCRRAARAPRGN